MVMAFVMLLVQLLGSGSRARRVAVHELYKLSIRMKIAMSVSCNGPDVSVERLHLDRRPEAVNYRVV